MLRAAMCPSSGELLYQYEYLVYVTLCRWTDARLHRVTKTRRPSGMHTRRSSSQVNLHTRRSSTQSDINQVSHWYNNSSDNGCPKHVENRNKHTWKIVCQVGCLQGSYQDVRSTEHEIKAKARKRYSPFYAKHWNGTFIWMPVTEIFLTTGPTSCIVPISKTILKMKDWTERTVKE